MDKREHKKLAVNHLQCLAEIATECVKILRILDSKWQELNFCGHPFQAQFWGFVQIVGNNTLE